MFTSESRKTTNIFSTLIITLTIVGVLCGLPAFTYAEEGAVVVTPTEVTSEVPEVSNDIVSAPTVEIDVAVEEVVVDVEVVPVAVSDEVETGVVPEATEAEVVVTNDVTVTDESVVVETTTSSTSTPEATDIDSVASSTDETAKAIEPTISETSAPTLVGGGASSLTTDETVGLEEVVGEESEVAVDADEVVDPNPINGPEVVSDENESPSDVTVVADEVVSLESSFDTESNDTNTTADENVSGENGFETDLAGNTALEAVSSENNFVTDSGSTTTVDEAVSGESDFTTDSSGTTIAEAISAENEFVTDSGTTIPVDESVSPEQDFTTDNSDGGCTSNCPVDEAVSPEQDFTTDNSDGGCTSNCPVDESVSPEQDFTTDNSDGGCTSNCGGGGGGGGGGGRRTTTILPPQCTLYLLTYMRQGYNNNAEEVRKLQIFLRVFEGFDIPVTGIYDQVTENAVRSFQNRYADDILTPWGIDADTGYAFITTTLKINYIYCGITTPITLDLRQRFPGLEIGPAGLQQLEELINNGIIPTTTASTTLPGPDLNVRQNIFQAAAVGLLNGLNFLWENICLLAWFLILILLAIIAWLLYRLNELKKELEKLKAQLGPGTGLAAGAVGLVTLDQLADTSDDVTAVDAGWDEYAESGGEEGTIDPTVMPLPLEIQDDEEQIEVKSTEKIEAPTVS